MEKRGDRERRTECTHKNKKTVTLSYVWTIKTLALYLSIVIYRLCSLMHCDISNTVFDGNLLEWTEKQENTRPYCSLHWAWRVSLKWQPLTIITMNGQMHACIMDGKNTSYVVLLSSLPDCSCSSSLVGSLQIYSWKKMSNLRSVGGGHPLWQSCTVQATCERENISVNLFTTSSSLMFISVSILLLSAGCNSLHQWGCFECRLNAQRQMSRVHSTQTHRILINNGGRGRIMLSVCLAHECLPVAAPLWENSVKLLSIEGIKVSDMFSGLDWTGLSMLTGYPDLLLPHQTCWQHWQPDVSDFTFLVCEDPECWKDRQNSSWI